VKWKNLIPMYLLMTLLLIASFLVVNYNLINQHEAVHKAIFESFGCTNTSMTTTPFSGHTICYGEHNISDAEESMHSFNEVVTYNDAALIDMLFFGVLIIITSLFVALSFFKPREPSN
jgi:hypothetical protein